MYRSDWQMSVRGTEFPLTSLNNTCINIIRNKHPAEYTLNSERPQYLSSRHLWIDMIETQYRSMSNQNQKHIQWKFNRSLLILLAEHLKTGRKSRQRQIQTSTPAWLSSHSAIEKDEQKEPWELKEMFCEHWMFNALHT